MPLKKHRVSSDSDDDMPLIVKQQGVVNVKIANLDLYKRAKQQCKFCNKVFNNRYDILVHNSHHIIVPLINHTVHSCLECKCHFPTENILTQHRQSQHGKKNRTKQEITKHKKNNRQNIISAKSSHHSNGHQIIDLQKLIAHNNDSQKPDDHNSVSLGSNCQNNNNEDQNDHNVVKTEKYDYVIGSGDDADSTAIITKMCTDDILNSTVTKEPVIRHDGVYITDPIKQKHVRNPIEKQPIILIEDILSRLLSKGIYKVKTVTEGDNNMLEITNINVKQEDIFSIENISQDNFSVATIIKSEPIINEDLNSKVISENIRNKLVFEDDEDDMITYNMDRRKKECSTNVPEANDGAGGMVVCEETEFYQGKIVLGSRVAETYTPSIHYDTLIEDLMYVCQRCGLISSNRYKSIQHEVIHMKFKRRLPPLCPFCDLYICGNYRNLKNHIDDKHPMNVKKNPHMANCYTCGLKYYNAYRHHRNYHLRYICSVCGKHFNSDTERAEHKDNHIVDTTSVTGKREAMKVIQLCEICFLFFKRTQQYAYLKEHSELGKKQKCDRCEKMFFNVTIVKYAVRRKPDKEHVIKKKKINSNEERLKHIQQRFKKINKLSRY